MPDNDIENGETEDGQDVASEVQVAEEAPETSSSSAGAPSQEEQVPAATTPPAKYKLKLNGEERELSYEELTQLASQGHDYTQKTQRLAEMARALKPAIDRWEREQLEAEKRAEAATQAEEEQLDDFTRLQRKVQAMEVAWVERQRMDVERERESQVKAAADRLEREVEAELSKHKILTPTLKIKNKKGREMAGHLKAIVYAGVRSGLNPAEAVAEVAEYFEVLESELRRSVASASSGPPQAQAGGAPGPDIKPLRGADLDNGRAMRAARARLEAAAREGLIE